jgi:importin-4
LSSSCPETPRYSASLCAQVRQIAAVWARRKITSHFFKLPEPTQAAVKAGLFHSLSHEGQYIVQKVVGNLVAALAKSLLPVGEWPELLNFLSQMVMVRLV